MGPIRVKRAAPIMVLVLMTGLIGASGTSATDSDVSRSASGKRMASEAAARFSAAGVTTRAADLKVYSLGNEEYLVAPAATKRVGRGVLTGGTAAASDFAIAASWQLKSSACFARYQNQFGWMDTCYHHHQLMSDGSSTYDYHELHLFATAKSKSPFALLGAWVESNRLGGAAQTWFDWDPGADSNTNCHPQSVGVSVAGVGIAYGHDHCDLWDITKYATAGRFRNHWKGYASRSERETAFVIAVRTAQGGYPVWSLNWNFEWVVVPG